MTFDADEKSGSSGFPGELFKFTRGPDEFFFTSGDQTVNFQAADFVPSLIKRTSPVQSTERGQANITITVPRDSEVALLFRIFVPASTMFITIFRFHKNVGLTPGPTDAVVFWQGRVRAVNFIGSEAEIDCEPFNAFLKRPGLRVMYQSTCNHMLYGPDCTVDRELFKVVATITSISGDIVTAPEFATQFIADPTFFFGGGFIETVDLDRRLIVEAGVPSDDDLRVLLPFENLAIGDTVFAFAGCDRTRQTCNTKFDNLDFFGGFPYIPDRNPFESGIR